MWYLAQFSVVPNFPLVPAVSEERKDGQVICRICKGKYQVMGIMDYELVDSDMRARSSMGVGNASTRKVLRDQPPV